LPMNAIRLILERIGSGSMIGSLFRNEKHLP
jgi:hypothetical protein